MALLIQTALELGLINALVVLALFLSYFMLNICDLSTDGCFTLGACVSAVVAISGHPYLSIIAALLAGLLSGLITSLLQTKMGIDSLLAGIAVNTGLFSINIAVMKGSSLLNMNKTETIYIILKQQLNNSFLSSKQNIIIAIIFVLLVLLLLNLFFKDKTGHSYKSNRQ